VQLKSHEEQRRVVAVLSEQLHAAEGTLRAKDDTLADLHTLLRRREAEALRLGEQLRAVASASQTGLTLPQLAARAAMSAQLHAQVAQLSRENSRLISSSADAASAKEQVAALQVCPRCSSAAVLWLWRRADSGVRAA